jgi:hypothetical protein
MTYGNEHGRPVTHPCQRALVTPVAIFALLLNLPVRDRFHVLCGVNIVSRLLGVDGMQEKVRGIFENHVERGDYAQMALPPPAGGGYISVVVATEQVRTS